MRHGSLLVPRKSFDILALYKSDYYYYYKCVICSNKNVFSERLTWGYAMIRGRCKVKNVTPLGRIVKKSGSAVDSVNVRWK